MSLVGLAYIDTEYEEEGMRERVEDMIRAEMRNGVRSTFEEYEPDFSDCFFLQTEYNRVKRGEKMKPFDTTRYMMKTPSSDASGEEWKEAALNSCAQLESLYGRLENLELLNNYQEALEVKFNLQSESMKRIYTNKISEIRQKIIAVNRERKASQIEAGHILKSLESQINEYEVPE